ncbi:MAG: GAF domain-containing SpoIIE family protein phosphatase [Cyanobacteriota bacterium]|nr:GAF domain-containing SpoIIE family protein phosphatase [Cyanobacteriota bacterium]
MENYAPETGDSQDNSPSTREERTRSSPRDAAEYALPWKLLETLVAMARNSQESNMLRATLQQALDVSTEFTRAEEGSIILLNRDGKIAHCISSRTEVAQLGADRLDRILDKGLAGWVARHLKVGLIIDTQDDERWLFFPDQPYIVRSALVIPIIRGGELLGIISLQHSLAGHFSRKTANLMQAIANQIALVLQNARLYSELMDSKIALNQELERGQAIQRNFLPEKLPQYPGWDIDALFQPARLVAGDFYDLFELPGQQLGIAIADVCDKGVGAALFMALVRSLLRIFSGQTTLERAGWSADRTSVLLDKLSSIPPPRDTIPQNQRRAGRPSPAHIKALKAIRLTNNYIALNHGDLAMFATVFFGILDPKMGTLTYINAGHNPLFIARAAGGIKEQLMPTGPAVGLFPNLKFRVRSSYIEPGEVLLGYTDGVTEARGEGGEFFGDCRLQDAIALPVQSAATLLEEIVARVVKHTGVARQTDDITLVAVRRETSTQNIVDYGTVNRTRDAR